MSFDILNRVNVLVKKTYYTYDRFNVEATFALLYHEKPLNVIELSKYIRITDQIMPLDDNHYFIIFSFTSQENAYKASQNILYSLDQYFNNQTSCIALDTFDTSKSPKAILTRLNQILAETRKTSYIRVETEEILDN
ncbi:MAG: hypothetical protein M1300_03345 [Epsilonproteobacteria bacterium]|nr:hypothetical protein [Campylobacterota bacterium]